jgi:hypothetical protein
MGLVGLGLEDRDGRDGDGVTLVVNKTTERM